MKRMILLAVMLFATSTMLSGCIFPHWGHGHGYGHGDGGYRDGGYRDGGGRGRR